MSELLWNELRRLLIAYVGPPDHQDEAVPALACVRQALPDAELWLWSAGPYPPVLPLIDHRLVAPPGWPEAAALLEGVAALQQTACNAALILSAPGFSPHPVAYACYLAGIPLRLGQSWEFGGGVLSHWVKPQRDVSSGEHHRYLLATLGLVAAPDGQSLQTLLVRGENV